MTNLVYLTSLKKLNLKKSNVEESFSNLKFLTKLNNLTLLELSKSVHKPLKSFILKILRILPLSIKRINSI